MDRFHGSARLLTAPDDAALLLKSLPAEIPYRGSTPTRHPRGTARTPSLAVLRALTGLDAPARVRQVKLELDDCPWSPIPTWYSAQRWLEEIPRAYQRLYTTHVAPHMPGNPISLDALLSVARARAELADHATGRNCRPTNKTLAAKTGLSARTVQRASKTLLLLGMATEVLRGRLRTLQERYASWRVKDRSRGWASVWALHQCRFRLLLSPHLLCGLLEKKPSDLSLLTTQQRRQAVADTPAPRGHDERTLRLARQWICAEDSPTWARRYRTPQAWANVLKRPADHGWTARDLNQLIRDFAGTRWLAATPDKPIALLGAILKWHGNLDERPAALDDAREAQELAAERARIAANHQSHQEHLRAQVQGQAAVGGPGHAAAMQAAKAASMRAVQRRTEEVRRETARTDAAIRAARDL